MKICLIEANTYIVDTLVILKLIDMTMLNWNLNEELYRLVVCSINAYLIPSLYK